MSFFNDDPPDRGLVRIDLAGKDPELWAKLWQKFEVAINTVLDSVSEKAEKPGFYQDLEKLKVSSLDYLRAKLEKPGVENALILAQVEQRLADASIKREERRIKQCEADDREFELAKKKLRTALLLMRARLIGEKHESALILGAQLQAAIEALAPEDSRGARQVLDSSGL